MNLNYDTYIDESQKGNPYISVFIVYDELRPFIMDLLQHLDGVRLTCEDKKDEHKIKAYPNVSWQLVNVELEICSMLSFITSDSALMSEFSGVHLAELNNYPSCKSHLKKGIAFIKKDEEYRNGLDELRLALELLCKKIFHNSKTSIERQHDNIIKRLVEKGYGQRFLNFIAAYLNSYDVYNNNQVKHADGENIKRTEAIVMMRNITGLIKLLL